LGPRAPGRKSAATAPAKEPDKKPVPAPPAPNPPSPPTKAAGTADAPKDDRSRIESLERRVEQLERRIRELERMLEKK
jgi:hypothetical protein